MLASGKRSPAPRSAPSSTASGFRQAAPGARSDYLEQIVARDAGRLIVIPVTHVIWIEAQDYYVRVHSQKGRYMLRATLASLESRLDPARFTRVHRAAIVNLAAVRGVEESQGLQLQLSDGETIAVSRTRRRDVEVALAALPGAGRA